LLTGSVGADVQLRAHVVPAQLHDIDKVLDLVGMHVGEEDGAELLGLYVDLREPQAGATSHIELQPHGVAIVAVVAAPHQCSRAGKTVEEAGPPRRAGYRHDEARSCLS